MKFTADTARTAALPPDKTDHLVFDDTCPGLGIRIRRSGTRTWIFQYQIGKRTPRLTLGRVEALTLTQARKRWGELHARVRQGGDPATDKAERVQHAAETMGAIVKTYLAQRRLVWRPHSLEHFEHCLLQLCKPLHALPLANIKRRTVASRLTEIATQNGPGASNSARAALSAFFSWAIRQGFLEANPVTGTERQPATPRDRVLSMAELVAIWRVCASYEPEPTRPSYEDYPLIIRLLMLTGARAGEIAGLRWTEVVCLADLGGDDCIRLPGARTKNKRPHTIPVTAPMAQILARRHPRPGNDQVFGLIPNHPFVGFERKNWLDEHLLGQMQGPWVVHDIRRSVATHLAERDIAPHIIEAILNHAGGHKAGVAGTYNRARYETQIKHALTMWGEYLLAAVEGKPVDAGKVVQLR